MRKHFYLLCALIFLLIAFMSMKRPAGSPSDSALKELQSAPPPQIIVRSQIPGIKLYPCSDSDFGIQFLCDYGWQIRRGDTSLFYTIDTNPDVKLKIIKIDIDILFIHQLSRGSIESIGQYEKGFVLEEVKVAGLNAIKVKAFSRVNPETRLSDYYFVYDKTLYSLMFSVNPKNRWDDYKFLIEDMVNSFKFTGISGRDT